MQKPQNKDQTPENPQIQIQILEETYNPDATLDEVLLRVIYKGEEYPVHRSSETIFLRNGEKIFFNPNIPREFWEPVLLHEFVERDLYLQSGSAKFNEAFHDAAIEAERDYVRSNFSAALQDEYNDFQESQRSVAGSAESFYAAYQRALYSYAHLLDLKAEHFSYLFEKYKDNKDFIKDVLFKLKNQSIGKPFLANEIDKLLPHYSNDQEFTKFLLQIASHFSTPASLKNIFNARLEKGSITWRNLTAEQAQDKKIVLKAAQHSPPWEFKELSKEMQLDPDVIALIISKDQDDRNGHTSILEYIHDLTQDHDPSIKQKAQSILQNRNLIKSALTQNSRGSKYVADLYKDDEEIALLTVREMEGIDHLSERLQNSRDFRLKAVTACPDIIFDLEEVDQLDPEFNIAAVTNDPEIYDELDPRVSELPQVKKAYADNIEGFYD